MKPGVAKGIHWRPKQSISQQVRTENITYLLTDRYVLGHVTGLNGFYLSRFKTPFLNLPVMYIPCVSSIFKLDRPDMYQNGEINLNFGATRQLQYIFCHSGQGDHL